MGGRLVVLVCPFIFIIACLRFHPKNIRLEGEEINFLNKYLNTLKKKDHQSGMVAPMYNNLNS